MSAGQDDGWRGERWRDVSGQVVGQAWRERGQAIGEGVLRGRGACGRRGGVLEPIPRSGVMQASAGYALARGRTRREQVGNVVAKFDGFGRPDRRRHPTAWSARRAAHRRGDRSGAVSAAYVAWRVRRR